MHKRDAYRVGHYVKSKKKLWRNSNQILIIVKRKKIKRWSGTNYEYFVTVPGAPLGQGSWLDHNEISKLTPLEQLAMCAE